MGDPFYRRDAYDRLDIGWLPFRKMFRKGAIEGKLTATFHFSPGSRTSNQQAFIVRMVI